MQVLKSFLLAALLAVCGPSFAGSAASGPFNVSITINTVCSVSTPANMSVVFDKAANLEVNADSAFTVQCSNGSPYTFNMDSTGNPFRNNLLAPITQLLYNLDVRDLANTPQVVGSTGTDAPQDFKVHLFIPNGQPFSMPGTDVEVHTIAVQF